MSHQLQHQAAIWEKGRWYEDFEPGQRITHHWGRTLSVTDNVLFCTSTLNFLPRYLDDAFGRDEGRAGAVLHPLLVLATVFGLSVEDLSEGGKGGPFLGVENVSFAREVLPGTTIRAVSSVVAKRESSSRPAFGIVTWRTEGRDARGDLLVEFERTNLVRRRIT
jgi:acyl dehydratase